jgi:DNA polymerase-1
MPKKIYLVDGNSFIYRMFFALPEFSTKWWKVVNATFWMAKFFTGQLTKEKPDYLVFIKDAKGENFRHKMYSEYKATREKMPDTLRSQIADIEEMIEKMGVNIIEIPGYEADDIIATLAETFKKETSHEVFILSWDKDLYALVNEQVKIYDTQKKKISGPEDTFEKFWVPPQCVRDYLAICGDSSDNIPGIAGIWPKKAQILLNEFWSLEKIYEQIDRIVASSSLNDGGIEVGSKESEKILKWKTLEKFIEGREIAFLSQKLATLEVQVPLENFDLEDYNFSPKEIMSPELKDFFKEHEFFSLLGEYQPELRDWNSLGKKVEIIGDSLGLKELEKEVFSGVYSEIILDTETSSLETSKADITGVSLCFGEEKLFYLNHLHAGAQLERDELKAFLRKILDSDLIIIGHNLKYDLQVIEYFLSAEKKETSCSQEQDFWQTTLGI